LLQTLHEGQALRQHLHQQELDVQEPSRMHMLRIQQLLPVVAVLVASAESSAQTPTKWECTFTHAAGYRGGEEKKRDPARYTTKPEKLDLTFLEASGKAYILGNNGASEVARSPTDRGGIQFVERPASGVLQVTAIDQFGNAVHSRHTVGFEGDLIASQFYGSCTKR
jgi:hypothetical protein